MTNWIHAHKMVGVLSGKEGGGAPCWPLVGSADGPPHPARPERGALPRLPRRCGSEKPHGPAWRPAARSPGWPTSLPSGGLLASQTWNGTSRGRRGHCPWICRPGRHGPGQKGTAAPVAMTCGWGSGPACSGHSFGHVPLRAPGVPNAEWGLLVRTEFSADFYQQNPCDPRTREEVNSVESQSPKVHR